MGKPLSIRPVHGLEVGHILEENLCFHYVGKGKPCCLQDGGEVVDHPMGHCFNATLYELSRQRVDRELARHKKEIPCKNCLGVGANRFGCALACNFLNFLHAGEYSKMRLDPIGGRGR